MMQTIKEQIFVVIFTSTFSNIKDRSLRFTGSNHFLSYEELNKLLVFTLSDHKEATTYNKTPMMLRQIPQVE